jgi:hypothetical protein
MNNLFTSSWIKNSEKIILEDTTDYIEEARGKKIADPLRAKLMGMQDIRDLKGTMTPRYFATKVIRQLQKEFPDVDVDDLDDKQIQQAINVVANISKPLATRSDIKLTTKERGTSEKELKKGDTGFETLHLNLDDDAVLSHEGDVGDNDLYTIIKNGLKYRVTLKDFAGTSVNLQDLDKDNIVSVVIVKPSETETVDKFAGEIPLGQREKLVADYPEGEEGDPRDNEYTPAEAPEDDSMGEIAPEDNEAIELHDKFYELMNKGDKEGAREVMMQVYNHSPETYKHLYNVFTGLDDEADSPEDAEINVTKSDLNKDGKLSEYEKARGQAIADAMEKQFGKKKEEDAERCPVTGKLRKKSSDEEEDEQTALSPQEISRRMQQQRLSELQNFYQQERLNRHGY